MKGRGRQGRGACLRSHHKVEGIPGPFQYPQHKRGRTEKEDERPREGTRKWHGSDGPA